MRTITLKTTTGSILYEGKHASIGKALESAISKDIKLDAIDLAYTDLRNVTLDGVSITGANFQEADLTGANMSESVFINCNFSGARLIDACLCYSKLEHCNFRYTSFGATDISMCALSFCAFEGWSTFHLEFDTAQILTNLTFSHAQNKTLFSEAPTIITGDGIRCAYFKNTLINKDLPYPFGGGTPPLLPSESSGHPIQKACNS